MLTKSICLEDCSKKEGKFSDQKTSLLFLFMNKIDIDAAVKLNFADLLFSMFLRPAQQFPVKPIFSPVQHQYFFCTHRCPQSGK